jgi:16S rRNA (guanine(1405)-N(7))-methyltransferase
MTSADIVAKILSSPKYAVLDPRVVARTVEAAAQRYGLKRADDEARRLLHQIWAIYYGDARLKATATNTAALLELHQSTKERLPILKDFYARIFAITGEPQTVVDYACGLNPLAFCGLGYTAVQEYMAFDIDEFTVKILNDQFMALGVADRFSAALGDLLIDDPKPADVAFLLKVFPCLELEQKGASRLVLERQLSKFVVVSYPLKSVSGKEKGMLEFYRNQWYEHVARAGWPTAELVFANELVFVVDKR